MFCANCGSKGTAGNAFCDNCGQKLEGAATKEQSGTQAHQGAGQAAPASYGAGGTAPGRTILKVVGILYVVFGGIGIFVAASGLAALDAVRGAAGMFGGGALAAQATAGLRGALIFALIVAGYQIFMGIVGIRFCAVLEKASMLLVLGVLALILVVIGLIISGFTILVIFSLPLPILYVIGAHKNRTGV